MPISYKHKIYTTLGTPTDLSGDVVSATDSAGVPVKDYTVKGRTIVWNQLLDKSKYQATTTTNGVTFTNNGDGTITANGTASSTIYYKLDDAISVSVGHKLLIYSGVSGGTWSSYMLYDDSDAAHGFDPHGTGKIYTAQKNLAKIYILVFKDYTCTNLVFKPQFFDLTQMFGAGNEPATPEEFHAMFPDYYYSYNVGELKTIVPTSIEASGINLFNLVGRKEISSDTVGYRTPTDAYPEIDTHVYYRGVSANGYLSSGNVVEATVLSSSVIAKTGTNPGSNGYGVGIPLTVVPSTTYYIKCTTSGVISVGYANSNKIITKFTGELSGPNITITTPGDCRYILVVFRPNALDTLATFENICVSTVQTNEYQPYKKYRADIPSSKYFPDGMRSAGSAYDEINFLSQKAIKRVGVRPYQAGDENNTGFITDKKNTVYALSTLVETEITPPLQALPTYKGFTSFSAPNSLTQNGPLSVTYYAEGGANPESGWLTSYKRKLYMGRNIEWNQLLDKSKYPATTTTNGVTFTNNGDGTITVNGTAGSTINIWHSLNANVEITIGHKVLISGGVTGAYWSSYLFYDDSDATYSIDSPGGGKIYTVKTSPVKPMLFVAKGYTVSNITFKPQLFDLTQMFGAGNEPATPEEFWSYFDHKLYPYNPGETQPLFKISRKSQWGSATATALYVGENIVIPQTVRN